MPSGWLCPCNSVQTSRTPGGCHKFLILLIVLFCEMDTNKMAWLFFFWNHIFIMGRHSLGIYGPQKCCADHSTPFSCQSSDLPLCWAVQGQPAGPAACWAPGSGNHAGPGIPEAHAAVWGLVGPAPTLHFGNPDKFTSLFPAIKCDSSPDVSSWKFLLT